MTWPMLLLTALLVSGCSKITRTKECGAFIDKVNAALKVIEQHTNTTGKDDARAVADMKKLGELYETLAKDVSALEITTPDLKTHAVEYQGMATKAAAAARQVAEAIEKKDQPKADTARAEFDKIVKQEDELVGKINGLCQAP